MLVKVKLRIMKNDGSLKNYPKMGNWIPKKEGVSFDHWTVNSIICWIWIILSFLMLLKNLVI